MGRIIPTCKGIAALAVLLATSAGASIPRTNTQTFVVARAAAEAGDARQAAQLYAALAAADPANGMLADRALAQAIQAGDMGLALRLAKARPISALGPDARLLLVADQLKRGESAKAAAGPWPSELSFLAPFVRAWSLSERGKWREAVAALDTAASDNLLAPLVPEHKALILLAARQTDQAKPLFDTALERAGGRADRLRINFAAGLVRAGDRTAATNLLKGRDVTLSAAARALGQQVPVTSAAQAYAELLTGLAAILGQNDNRALQQALVQVARFADPQNSQATILLGLLEGARGNELDALVTLRSIPDSSPFASEAHDAEIRTLLRADRKQEALARAQAFASAESATADDWSRVGDVLDDLDRHAEAATAYGRALSLAEAGAPGPEVWSLHLLRGASLEEGDRWAEAEKALETARAQAPQNPVVLNYLGYARLERGQRMDEAEALIAEASKLAPDDPSITDSLGWAQFKRGKVDQAIATLQRAAAGDPAQSEINEHLGDALYTVGRKYEARFAWNAALVTAEDDVRGRIEAKIAGGLTKATAAP